MAKKRPGKTKVTGTPPPTPIALVKPIEAAPAPRAQPAQPAAMPRSDAFGMGNEEVLNRLAINDSDLVEELQSTIENLVDGQEKRQSLIEGKASSLLGTVGLVCGLVFTFGGMLFEKVKPGDLSAAGFSKLTPVLVYFGIVLTGCACAVLSWMSLRVRKEYKTIDEESLFDRDALAGGRDYYRRFMAAHLWFIYRNNFRVNERKAAWLLWSQRVFLVFVVGLLLTTACFGRLIVFRQDEVKDGKEPNRTATTSSGPTIGASASRQPWDPKRSIGAADPHAQPGSQRPKVR